jgi:chromosomal replication initiation ATPase DnaA
LHGRKIFYVIERMTRRYEMKQSGIGMAVIEERVCRLSEMYPKDLYARGRRKELVEARSVFCFFAVTELKTALKDLAVRFSISGQAVGPAIERGRRIAEKKGLEFIR